MDKLLKETKEGMDETFGESKQTDIFRKSTKVIRSPLKKVGRTGSFSEIEGKISSRKNRCKEEEENEKKKRKREGVSDEEGKSSKMGKQTLIQTLKKKIVALKEAIDKNALKTAEMYSTMEEIMSLMDQVEAEETIRIEVEKDGNLKQRREINGLIMETNTYDQFREIEGAIWPKECFVRTVVKTGVCPMGEGDIALLKGRDDLKMEKDVAKRFRESFPELVDMNGGKWETLIMHTKRNTRGKGEQIWERQIHIGQEAEGTELFHVLMELKTYLIEMGRRKILLPLEEHMDAYSISKMLECILRDCDIKVTIYSAKAKNRTFEEGRVHQNNAIIIKANSGNYAETLKKIKEDLTVGGTNTTVKKIRSTRNGEMLIELKDGDDGANLERILKEKENLEVRILDKDRGKRKKYVIRDLDAVTTREEIEEIIKRTAIKNEEAEEVKVLSLRRAFGDTQTAIVQINREHGERLQKRGGMKFGLVQGILREWVDIDRCFKCWEYGHRAPECKGPDRSRNCLKCGKEGHEARNCSEEAYCPICQRQGHRAGSGACPKMRNMLTKLRKQEADRRKRRTN